MKHNERDFRRSADRYNKNGRASINREPLFYLKSDTKKGSNREPQKKNNDGE